MIQIGRDIAGDCSIMSGDVVWRVGDGLGCHGYDSPPVASNVGDVPVPAGVHDECTSFIRVYNKGALILEGVICCQKCLLCECKCRQAKSYKCIGGKVHALRWGGQGWARKQAHTCTQTQ